MRQLTRKRPKKPRRRLARRRYSPRRTRSMKRSMRK